MKHAALTTLFLMLNTSALSSAKASDVSATAASMLGHDTDSDVRVIGQSTEFGTTGRYANRAYNVALAAKLLDGAVILPGEVLSFNDRVGERSSERGFLNAPVIANGRIRQGLGGGVCQVSTTLHLAALTGGLEIVEHRTHSRTSSYADAGLDATVAWGTIDYKVRNPYDFPITVRAFAADGVMRVELEGAELPELEITTAKLRDLPVRDRIVVDESLAAGERVVESEGRAGSVIRVMRIAEDGTREVFRERYPSAPRVVRVGATSPMAGDASDADAADVGDAADAADAA